MGFVCFVKWKIPLGSTTFHWIPNKPTLSKSATSTNVIPLLVLLLMCRLLIQSKHLGSVAGHRNTPHNTQSEEHFLIALIQKRSSYCYFTNTTSLWYSKNCCILFVISKGYWVPACKDSLFSFSVPINEDK